MDIFTRFSWLDWKIDAVGVWDRFPARQKQGAYCIVNSSKKLIGTHQLVDRIHPRYGNMVLAGSNFILLMLHRDIF